MKEGRGVYLRRMGQLNEDGYTEIAVATNYFSDDAWDLWEGMNFGSLRYWVHLVH